MSFSNLSNEFETFTFHLLLWNHFATFNQLGTKNPWRQAFMVYFSYERKIIVVGQKMCLSLQIIIKSLYFNTKGVCHDHHFEFCILVFDFFYFEPTMSQSRG